MTCSQFSWQISFQDQNYMLIRQRQLQGTLLPLWGIFRWLLQPAATTKEFWLIIDQLRLGVKLGKKETGDEWTHWMPNVNDRHYYMCNKKKTPVSCKCYAATFRLIVVAVVDWRRSRGYLVTQQVKKLWIVYCCCISLWFIILYNW